MWTSIARHRAVPSLFRKHRNTSFLRSSVAAASSASPTPQQKKKGEIAHRVAGFPEFIDAWNAKKFYTYGALASAFVAGTTYLNLFAGGMLAVPLIGYWAVGLRDVNQKLHTIRRNFPVLGNIRYIFETIRPEIRQYFIEGDHEPILFDRYHRNIAYQRAKGGDDTLPFGCRKDMYASGYEWVSHSMFPTQLSEDENRVMVGANNPECKQPYSAAIFNVSAMSYGALSDNAILALSKGASMGNFYHNTGEGGVSRFHLEGGADIVWNVGTGFVDHEFSFCAVMQLLRVMVWFALLHSMWAPGILGAAMLMARFLRRYFSKVRLTQMSK